MDVNTSTMKKQQSYMRYYKYDTNNVKYIKRFELGETIPEPEVGYTPWMRGTGPHNPISLNNVRNGVSKACKGVPKTPECKEKMRQAKLGVPKSQEHKENMRKSWERRRDLILQETHAKAINTSTTQTSLSV